MVDERTGQGGGHCELGTAVGADNGIERLPKHIERYAQGNPEKVFLGVVKGFSVDLPAEQDQNRLLEYQIESRQKKAGYDTQQYRAADALVGGILVSLPG